MSDLDLDAVLSRRDLAENVYAISAGTAPAELIGSLQDVPRLVDEVRKLRAMVERAGLIADELDSGKYGDPAAMAGRIRGALDDQCHHDDGAAECWHFGDREGRDG